MRDADLGEYLGEYLRATWCVAATPTARFAMASRSAERHSGSGTPSGPITLRIGVEVTSVGTSATAAVACFVAASRPVFARRSRATLAVTSENAISADSDGGMYGTQMPSSSFRICADIRRDIRRDGRSAACELRHSTRPHYIRWNTEVLWERP